MKELSKSQQALNEIILNANGAFNETSTIQEMPSMADSKAVMAATTNEYELFFKAVEEDGKVFVHVFLDTPGECHMYDVVEYNVTDGWAVRYTYRTNEDCVKFKINTMDGIIESIKNPKTQAPNKHHYVNPKNFIGVGMVAMSL